MSQGKIFRGLSSVLVTGITLIMLAIFLAPFLFMVFTSLKTQGQISELGTPIWPAEAATFEYNGKKLDVYKVPQPDGSVKTMALLKKTNKQSTFVDVANPEAEPYVWDGSYRTLDRNWKWAPYVENYKEVWTNIKFLRVLMNTAYYAVVSMIGALISALFVAYGFARFRFPGRDFLFVVLISTIFLPAAVTVIPTYTFFQKIGLVGTWWPVILPHFFANAYNVFLFRQYFMTLPKELDEAAMIDGAGPLRILFQVILPQSYPVLMAVVVFHIVFAWNDFFNPLIYLSTNRDAWPVSVALTTFNGIYGQKPQLIQAGALMALGAPLLLFLLAQRLFIQGVVITGVEK
jgi:multiple sugar transport system permease protein